MKLSWLPDSFEAAVAITDDPDNSSFSKFKSIYDFLMEINFPTTRAMWVYTKSEFTGTPHLEIDFTAPLLTDPQCLQYCKKLHGKGFEICLHGASCGNNKRQRTLDALNFLAENIKPSPVFICHSKNAENLYWDTKTANLWFEKKMLQLYTKNQCFGEVSGTEYFWGDVCQKQIDFIRLYRTRSVNTLAFNPSMPYHDFSKPLVNYWFSATKGYIPFLFTKNNIDLLCEQNGASILYQYMHRYVNDDMSINCEAKKTLEMVANDSRILIKPVSIILNRLKSIQNILVVKNREFTYLINTSNKVVESVKIKLDRVDDFYSEEQCEINKIKKEVIFTRISSLSFIKFKTSDRVSMKISSIDSNSGFGTLKYPKATVYLNLSENEKTLRLSSSEIKVKASGVYVNYLTPDAERLNILKEISLKELYKLKAGQVHILLREHILLGRKISTKNYLNDPGKIENLSNW